MWVLDKELVNKHSHQWEVIRNHESNVEKEKDSGHQGRVTLDLLMVCNGG